MAVLSIKRPTYDWLAMTTDGELLLAHGCKSWRVTSKLFQEYELKESARLSQGCKAELVDGEFKIYKQGQYLGSIRPIQRDFMSYRWETSTPSGDWAPSATLGLAAKGWNPKHVWDVA